VAGALYFTVWLASKSFSGVGLWPNEIKSARPASQTKRAEKLTPMVTHSNRSRARSQAQKKSSYDARVIKRFRRSKNDLKNLLEAVQRILANEEFEISIRHLFYRLVGLEVIEKTEADYQAVIKHTANFRRDGLIDWDAFADSTRWHIKPPAYDSFAAALENTAATYRRDLWQTQSAYIELWCEKDAMAGVIARAAESFGVPVFVARGFASLSSLFNAANTFREQAEHGKRCVIYHFGDYDPSGVAAGESMVKSFKGDFKVNVEFIRAAVTEQQIISLKLPTRPVKWSDTRAAKWEGGECVELDSMPTTTIRELVKECIVQHIDQRAWDILETAEESERQMLASIARTWKGFK
jgi:hypothetical protein